MRRLSLILAVPLLILTACSGEASTSTTAAPSPSDSITASSTEPAPDDTAGTVASAEETDPVSETTGPAPDDTAGTVASGDETDPTDPPAALTGGDDCLLGTWELDVDAFASGLEELYSGTGAAAEVTIDGRSIIEFREGGVFTGGYDDFVATANAEGLPPIEIRFEGVGEGSWEADGSLVSLRPDSVDVTIDTLMGGQPVGDFGFDIGALVSFEATDAPYTCDEQTIAIDVADGVDYRAARID